MTFETVIAETPASSATSVMLAFRRASEDLPFTRRPRPVSVGPRSAVGRGVVARSGAPAILSINLQTGQALLAHRWARVGVRRPSVFSVEAEALSP
ncbi:hypothetical protein GCM10028833_35610 [Glycomyces tarimensis]